MENNKIKFKAKYFIPFYGIVNFGEDNKYKVLQNSKEGVKFLALTASMYLCHFGFAFGTFKGLEHLLK